MSITCRKVIGLAAGALTLSALAACDENSAFNLAGKQDVQAQEDTAPLAKAAPRRMVGKDVEAPDVFSATEEGLWDGRPSLGGIWVAHPDVTAPERVVIRNTSNGKSVTGALFRRERDLPGPTLQISSDAAAALGIVAGKPQELSVTALRRGDVSGETSEPEDNGTAAASEDVTRSTSNPVSVTAARNPAAG